MSKKTEKEKKSNSKSDRQMKLDRLLLLVHPHKISELEAVIKENPELIDLPCDMDGNSALVMAAQKGYDDVVRLLIKMGAYINFRANPFSIPAIVHIFNAGNFGLVLEMAKSGANVTDLSWTIKNVPTLVNEDDVLKTIQAKDVINLVKNAEKINALLKNGSSKKIGADKIKDIAEILLNYEDSELELAFDNIKVLALRRPLISRVLKHLDLDKESQKEFNKLLDFINPKSFFVKDYNQKDALQIAIDRAATDPKFIPIATRIADIMIKNSENQKDKNNTKDKILERMAELSPGHKKKSAKNEEKKTGAKLLKADEELDGAFKIKSSSQNPSTSISSSVAKGTVPKKKGKEITN